MEQKSTRIGYLLLLPSVALIAVMIVYPAANTIYQSFFEIRTQTAALGPKFVGVKNYIRAFHDQHFWDTLWWTLIFTSVSVFIELVIGMGPVSYTHLDVYKRQPLYLTVSDGFFF